MDAAFPEFGEDLPEREVGLLGEPPQRDFSTLVPLERLFVSVLVHGAFDQSPDDDTRVDLLVFADALDRCRELVGKAYGEGRAHASGGTYVLARR